MTRSILVVEDDAAVSLSLVTELSGLGHRVTAAPSAELGLAEARRAPPALVLLDLNLPGKGGLEVLPDLLELRPQPTVVVITANPTAENAMDAIARGALDHLPKPFEPGALAAVLARAFPETLPSSTDGATESSEAGADSDRPRPIVGATRGMLELGRRIGALARSEVSVLIRGASGTGKELVARAIHERSARGEGPFVGVSCAALPETLLEAELFGHAKGAFTGAHTDRPGRVERASGGTLFLDEVAELTPPAQAKLLRFLEERTFERVGETTPRRAEVRILAATNAPLEDRVADGSFREDLYYRLDVARVELPLLRDRLEDLPLLVEHFLAAAARSSVRVDPGAYAALLARPWPGNVRELRNAIEAALVALGPGDLLRAEHLPAARIAVPTSGEGSWAELEQALRSLVIAEHERGAEGGLYADARAALERTLVAAALEVTGTNQVAAAKLLGMNRATFRRKMADHGLGAEEGG